MTWQCWRDCGSSSRRHWRTSTDFLCSPRFSAALIICWSRFLHEAFGRGRRAPHRRGGVKARRVMVSGGAGDGNRLGHLPYPGGEFHRHTPPCNRRDKGRVPRALPGEREYLLRHTIDSVTVALDVATSFGRTIDPGGGVGTRLDEATPPPRFSRKQYLSIWARSPYGLLCRRARRCAPSGHPSG